MQPAASPPPAPVRRRFPTTAPATMRRNGNVRSEGGLRSGSEPTPRALRRVAGVFYDGWAAGGLGRGGPDEAEIATAGCRVMALALATVERAADDASRGQWEPDDEGAG